MNNPMTLDQLNELGFDRSFERADETIKVRCSQCEAMVINGTPTHETGCPNIPIPDDNWEEEAFNGYWYRDANGNDCHTWDFEESIGE